MTPKCSLRCSQQPDTGPYVQPDESIPHSPTLLQIRFNIILPSTILFFRRLYKPAKVWIKGKTFNIKT
jgi:hypothetical protein